jgi:hypothetical protein
MRKTFCNLFREVIYGVCSLTLMDYRILGEVSCSDPGFREPRKGLVGDEGVAVKRGAPVRSPCDVLENGVRSC